MAEIIWSDEALEDINNIAEYIAISNILAAKALVKRIFNKIERLAEHPLSGRIPTEISDLNYREVIVNPCRIFYKVEDGKVYIIFVMRQEQDLKRYIYKFET